MAVAVVVGGEELVVLGMAVEAEEAVKATSKTSTNRSSNHLPHLVGQDVHYHTGMSMPTRAKRRRLNRVGAGVCAVTAEFMRQIWVWEEEDRVERERTLCRELSQ